MVTRAQMKANGNNAKKSTGPRTEKGKAHASKNALKHGLLARDTVLPGEDPADFDRQLSALEADIQPANSLEFELVRQIADAQWRMRRLTRLETGFRQHESWAVGCATTRFTYASLVPILFVVKLPCRVCSLRFYSSTFRKGLYSVRSSDGASQACARWWALTAVSLAGERS